MARIEKTFCSKLKNVSHSKGGICTVQMFAHSVEPAIVENPFWQNADTLAQGKRSLVICPMPCCSSVFAFISALIDSLWPEPPPCFICAVHIPTLAFAITISV